MSDAELSTFSSVHLDVAGGAFGNAEACDSPRLSEYGCGEEGRAQGRRLCSYRSLCAITTMSGHLLFCLAGDRSCPRQQLLSESASAARRSLKLPVELSCGCPQAGRTHRPCLEMGGKAGGLVPFCHFTQSPLLLVVWGSLSSGLLHTWVPADRQTDTLQTDLLTHAARLECEMG